MNRREFVKLGTLALIPIPILHQRPVKGEFDKHIDFNFGERDLIVFERGGLTFHVASIPKYKRLPQRIVVDAIREGESVLMPKSQMNPDQVKQAIALLRKECPNGLICFAKSGDMITPFAVE